MVVKVDEQARIGYIRPVLLDICSVVAEVWNHYGVEVPVLTGGTDDPGHSYSDEPSHELGWAYDFRVSDLPPDRVILAYHDVVVRLRSHSDQFRAILFYNGHRYLGSEVTIDTVHPNHLHIALQR